MIEKTLVFRVLAPFLVPEPGFAMAAKRRHWKQTDARFQARIAIPKDLQPCFEDETHPPGLPAFHDRLAPPVPGRFSRSTMRGAVFATCRITGSRRRGPGAEGSRRPAAADGRFACGQSGSRRVAWRMPFCAACVGTSARTSFCMFR